MAEVMALVHLELSAANAFVAAHHRHHQPVRGHRFSLGAVRKGRLVGVAIVGRPVSREVDYQTTVEVTRLCTDGTRNACSYLYGAAARAAKSLGYCSIQTYILDSEVGASLRAAGWQLSHTVKGRQWKHTKGKPRRTDQPTCDKICYRRVLADPVFFDLPMGEEDAWLR